MAALRRLLDIVDLIEDDARVQILFTVAPDVFNITVESHLRGIGALVIPWQQATREKFDLAIAAAHGGLHELHAPIVLMAHGAGRARLVQPSGPGGRPVNEQSVYGLDAPRLVRDGRIVASALLLSHDHERQVLLRQCPEAAPLSVVVGDPCFDRLVSGLPQRRRYRRMLGVSDDRSLVVISSTWGEKGLFGSAPQLLPRLIQQLPAAACQVATLLHPAIWAAHGRRQVLAWTRACRTAGMILVDPGDDWRPYIAAADRLIGDQGSVTAYGAAIGLPVLRVRTAAAALPAAGSPQSVVLAEATLLDPQEPLHPQVLNARPIDRNRVAGVLTSQPGRAGQLIRRTLYRLMGLPDREMPGDARGFGPSSDPNPGKAA
ncbi:hypothetical protein Asp14428_35400 [Actinoplanes sp. NBRC 14428]|nr:hypothetical protein Asp14428_35400 [Actinoplanes sp. NBRC 14428]